MKGQANALMYPDPYMRTPGDIDLWTDAKTLDIIRVSRKLDKSGEIGYHHIELSYFKTPVEIHFFPSFMGNVWHEYKLRRFFNSRKEAQFKVSTLLPDNLGSLVRLQTISIEFSAIASYASFLFRRYWITSDDRLLLSIEARTYR